MKFSKRTTLLLVLGMLCVIAPPLPTTHAGSRASQTPAAARQAWFSFHLYSFYEATFSNSQRHGRLIKVYGFVPPNREIWRCKVPDEISDEEAGRIVDDINAETGQFLHVNLSDPTISPDDDNKLTLVDGGFISATWSNDKSPPR